MTLDYISIDATIRRLNDTLGADWSTEPVSTEVTPLEGGKYLATVTLALVALGKRAVGVGADVAGDADKAVKTALAEALKKAGHQFGIGLYLWLEEERERLVVQRAATDVPGMQRAVLQKAIDGGADGSPESVVEFYGLGSVEQLRDASVLKKLLEG